jgi:hypothetical protein
MRLQLPDAELPRGVEITCSPIRPGPVDDAAWRALVIASDGGGAAGAVEAARTTAGWPVLLVRVEGAAGPRLYGFYTLIDRVCAVTATGADAAAVDAARPVLLGADVDWQTDELLAIAQLWQV